MSATQTLPLYQANDSPDWALIENVDQRQLAETHLAPGEPASACKLSTGTGALGSGNGALDVAAGSVIVNGTAHDIVAQSVDIPYGDDNPRRDVVYVDGDGAVQVRLGQPAPFAWADELEPTSQTLKNAYRPAPPDLVSTSGFVLGVITIEADAASLAAEGVIHDTRIGPPVATPAEGSLDRPYTELSGDMDESETRTAINTAADGTTFWVEPGASWTVTDQLVFPDGIRFYGNTPMREGGWTFAKGFNGVLATIGQYSTFYNVNFWGNRGSYSGNLVEAGAAAGRNTRNTSFHQCNFRRAAGDGWHGDNFFITWDQCLFQNNDGWGIWLGDEENPHNQMLGPCYIGGNGAGGIYQNSHGRNQQFYAYVGNNGGPGIQWADPNGRGGFIGFAFRGALVNNDGPAYLVIGGNQRNHRIADVQIANNAAAPASGLSAPVGHIQVEGGSLDATIEGGQSYGHSQLINSPTADAHTIVLDSQGAVHKGDVDGANLSFELRGERAVLDGTVNAGEFARYGPDGSRVDELSVTNVYSRAHQTARQTIPDSTFTQLEYDSSDTDDFGGFDLTNNQFDVQQAGVYLIISSVRMRAAPSGSRVIARIDTNGTELARADSHAAKSGGGTVAGRVDDVVRLTAGDTITTSIYQDSGESLDTFESSAGTYLSVAKLG